MKIIREDGLELGFISEVAYTPPSRYGAYRGSGTWLASLLEGGNKYFAHYDNAVRWLERENKNIYPISRLAEFINK